MTNQTTTLTPEELVQHTGLTDWWQEPKTWDELTDCSLAGGETEEGVIYFLCYWHKDADNWPKGWSPDWEVQGYKHGQHIKAGTLYAENQSNPGALYSPDTKEMTRATIKEILHGSWLG